MYYKIVHLCIVIRLNILMLYLFSYRKKKSYIAQPSSGQCSNLLIPFGRNIYRSKSIHQVSHTSKPPNRMSSNFSVDIPLSVYRMVNITIVAYVIYKLILHTQYFLYLYFLKKNLREIGESHNHFLKKNLRKYCTFYLHSRKLKKRDTSTTIKKY